MSNLLSSSLEFALEFTDNPQLNKIRPVRSCNVIPFTLHDDIYIEIIHCCRKRLIECLSALEHSSLLEHSY